MTKAELVSAIAKGAGITKKQADAALKAASQAVSSALKKGERVAVPGFGIFAVRTRAARKGRYPRNMPFFYRFEEEKKPQTTRHDSA